MSIFDQYHRKEIRRDEHAALARANPTARARMLEANRHREDLVEGGEAQELARLKKMAKAARAIGGSSAHIDGLIKKLQAIVDKKKKKALKEDGPMPPPGDPGMPPAPGGPPPPQGGGNSPAKAFTEISVDAANFLAQKESELAGLPPDSPELAMVRNAEGLLKEYTPDPTDDDRMVSSKVALLSKQLRDLEGGNASGEVATYLRAFAGKIDEFRATIDVSNSGPEVLGKEAPEPEAAPEPAPKEKPKDEPPSPEEREQDLAKGLDLNIH